MTDGFVDGLDLRRLEFQRVETAATGRPPYAPGDLLKLYIYGYMNQMRSSRPLEREAQRNLEVCRLIDRVRPSFKTIADFRRDHAQAIVATCREFIRFCCGQSMMGGAIAAIDGTKIFAVASRKKVVTAKALDERLAAVEAKVRDCPQLVIGLVVTPEGLPLAYEVLPGNSKTLRLFLSKIETQYGKARRVWVMDRGVPTEAVLAQMRASDPPVQYLVGTPKGRLNRLEKHLIEKPSQKAREGSRSSCWPRTRSSMCSRRAPTASPRSARCGDGS